VLFQEELVSCPNGIFSVNVTKPYQIIVHHKSAGLAGVSSEMGLDDGLLVCTLLLLI